MFWQTLWCLHEINKYLLALALCQAEPLPSRGSQIRGSQMSQHPWAECVTSGVCSCSTKKAPGRLTWQVRKQLQSDGWRVCWVSSICFWDPLSVVFCSLSCKLIYIYCFNWFISLHISVEFEQLGALQITGRGKGMCLGIYFSPCRVSMGWQLPLLKVTAPARKPSPPSCFWIPRMNP